MPILLSSSPVTDYFKDWVIDGILKTTQCTMSISLRNGAGTL